MGPFCFFYTKYLWQIQIILATEKHYLKMLAPDSILFIQFVFLNSFFA